MIAFKYDILFGLMFWEIKDVERIPNWHSAKHIPTPTDQHLGFRRVDYNRTQNK